MGHELSWFRDFSRLFSSPKMNITEYRTQFAAFNSSLALLQYQQYLGNADRTVAQLRSDNSDLFSAGALQDLQRSIDELRSAESTEGAARTTLLGAARLEHLELRLAELNEELDSCETSARLTPNETTSFATAIDSLLATESNKEQRDERFKRFLDLIASCNDLRLTRVQLLQEEARRLGFESYSDLIGSSFRINLEQVARAAETLLERTEPLQRAAFARLTPQLLFAAKAQPSFADLAFLQHSSWLDHFFASHNWSKIYAETMAPLGIRVDKQPNLQIKWAETSRNRQALTAAVDPPRDVRLLLAPPQSVTGFAGALHAAGLAQHFFWNSKDLAANHPEFIYCADRATSESSGYLLEILLLEPRWLEQFLKPVSKAELDELSRDLAAVLLLRLRRQAAQSLFALTLFQPVPPSVEQSQAAFVDLHERATGFHFQRQLFLLNSAALFSCVNDLRAFVFAAGLREHLRHRYGHRWWTTRKAGDELIDLWNTASRYPVEELAGLIGFEFSFDLIPDLLSNFLIEAKN